MDQNSSRRICLLSAVAYGTMSLIATILNKLVITRLYFDYTIVILMLQMALTLVVIESARLLRLISIPAYTLERGKDMMIPSLLYACHSYFSLASLQGMNIPMYGTLKRCVPLVTLYLSVAILKKPLPNRNVIFAVILITVGAVIASFYDFKFDMWAYIYGGISIVSQAFYLILIERLSATAQYSTLEMIYMHSFNCMCYFLLADLISDEIRDAFMFFVTSATFVFWLAFAGVLVTGLLLNFSAFYCTTRNSALTTTVVGNVKAVLQTIVGYLLGIYLFYDVVPNFLNIFGIGVNLCGCFLYGFAKSKDFSSTHKQPDINSNKP